MHQNDAIGQNELVVNDLLIRTYKLVLLFLPVLFILKAANVFTAAWSFVTGVVITDVAFCIIPIAYRQLRMDVKKQKNINVICAVILVMTCYSLFHLNVALTWLVPVCFACLYFDMRLIKQAVGLTIPALAAGELLHAYSGLHFAIMNEVYFRIAAFAVQALILAALFLSVARRAERMLQGAHGFYENVNALFSGAYAASQSLQLSGKKLEKSMETLAAAEASAEQADHDGAEPGGEPDEDVGEAGGSPDDSIEGKLVSNLNRTRESAREIVKYTQAVIQADPAAEENGTDTESDLSHIEEYMRKSKQVLGELAGYSEKIKEDLDMMTVIIEESRLLSVNAAKEMEEAAKGGDGSVILGMKIGELADESVRSAAHIQQALSEIVHDAEKTVTTITETYADTVKELELINRTVETLMKWLMYKNMH